MERQGKIEQAAKERERVRLENIPKKWNRREEYEFLRVLTGYGIDLQQSSLSTMTTTGVIIPDWQKFKIMSRLERKSDETLNDYYKVFIAMCKRQAGLKLNDNEKGLEGIIDDISEDHAKLVLDRLELLSKLREISKHPLLDERIKLCQNNFDTPDWWESGKHDKELIIAVLKHGLYRSECFIFNDPQFSFLESEKRFARELELQIRRNIKNNGNESHLSDLLSDEVILIKEEMKDIKKEFKIEKFENCDTGKAEVEIIIKGKRKDKIIEKEIEKEEEKEIEKEKKEDVEERNEKEMEKEQEKEEEDIEDNLKEEDKKEEDKEIVEKEGEKLAATTENVDDNTDIEEKTVENEKCDEEEDEKENEKDDKEEKEPLKAEENDQDSSLAKDDDDDDDKSDDNREENNDENIPENDNESEKMEEVTKDDELAEENEKSTKLEVDEEVDEEEDLDKKVHKENNVKGKKKSENVKDDIKEKEEVEVESETMKEEEPQSSSSPLKLPVEVETITRKTPLPLASSEIIDLECSTNDDGGDPDDDEVMKEKEKASSTPTAAIPSTIAATTTAEEEVVSITKQAAELKARFPDLEVIQPQMKIKQEKDKIKVENMMMVKWFRDFALEKRISHIVTCVEKNQWPVGKNYSAYTGCQGMDLDIPLYETITHINVVADSSSHSSRHSSITPDVITITTDSGMIPKHLQAQLSGTSATISNVTATATSATPPINQMPPSSPITGVGIVGNTNSNTSNMIMNTSISNTNNANNSNSGSNSKKRKRHIAIDVETERAKLHALLNSTQVSSKKKILQFIFIF